MTSSRNEIEYPSDFEAGPLEDFFTKADATDVHSVTVERVLAILAA